MPSSSRSSPSNGGESLCLPTKLTIPALLTARAAQVPDRVALRVRDTRVTYADLATRVGSVAGALTHHGVGRGDVVATMASNRLELVDVLLGCAWLGAVAAPLNTASRGESLRRMLGTCTRVLVEPEYVDRITDSGFDGEMWVLGSDAGPVPGTAPAVRPAAVSPTDTAAILYTSGTTGVPEGVRCPHAQFLWWGHGVGTSLGVTSHDVLHNGLPLFHTNAIGALFQAFVAGATVVVGERFSVRGYWREVTDADATVGYLLGAMVAMLLGAPGGAYDRAHRVTRILAPATPTPLYGAFRERFGAELIDGYGSTETNLVLGALAGEHRPGFMGRVMPGYEAIVVDERGETVPDGTPGELWVRTALDGAFALGDLAGPAAEPGSWVRTGDRVVRDVDGWFRFVDRIKDVIRRRGENISSIEVEQALARHPDVERVAVFPVPSQLAEDEVMAAVVARPGRDLDPADLRRFVQPLLASFALPRYIEVVDALAVTATGKVSKGPLRERGVGVRTWDADASRR